jgi:hypothetical protein
MQFTAFQALAENKKKTWLPLNDALLSQRAIPSDIEVDVKIAGERTSQKDEEEIQTPQIIISTNGDVTPFTIYIGKKGERPRYMIVGEADGNVVNKSIS